MCKVRRQRNFQSVCMALANYIIFNVHMCAVKELFFLHVTAKRDIRFFVPVSLISVPCSHLYWAYCQPYRNVEKFRSRKWLECLLWCQHISLPCVSSCFVPLVSADSLDSGVRNPSCGQFSWVLSTKLALIFELFLNSLYLSYAGCPFPHCWP